MSNFFFRRTFDGLEPMDDDAHEALNRFSVGDVVELPLVRHRNSKFNAKYHVLLRLLFDNQARYDNIDVFKTAVKVMLGHCITAITPSGETIYIPRSISFAKMDDVEFEQKIYKPTIDLALTHFISNGSLEDIRNAVDQIVGFA